MGNVRLYGSTSGYTELAPPAVAPDGVLSLPSGTGTLATTADVAAAGGKILQVVSATSGVVSTTSSSYVNTGLTATITPTSATSTILVMVQHTGVAKLNDNTTVFIQLLRDATAISLFEQYAGFTSSTDTANVGGTGINYIDSPATTSAVVYKTQFRSLNTLTSPKIIYLGQNNGVSSIVLMEVAA